MEALTELMVHAARKKELHRPSVRKAVGTTVMNEADAEHQLAKLLIAELDREDRSESHCDGKLTELAEHVRHHVRQPDVEMLPKAGGTKVDFAALAERCAARRRSYAPTASCESARRSWSMPAAAKAIPRSGGPAEGARITQDPKALAS
jgi:hypothetical protein